jgi:Fur family ferric uptake transcriptional regulator
MVDPAVFERVRVEARRRGVRWTSQRQAILEILAASEEHITADELHRQVVAHDRTVSAATVYRTVNLLVELGVVSKGDFGASSASFEWKLTKRHHDHLVCMACGTITEFQNGRIEKLQDEIAKEHGFALSHHRLDLFGLCPACLRTAVAGKP